MKWVWAALLGFVLLAGGYCAWQWAVSEPAGRVVVARLRLEISRSSEGEASTAYGERASDLGVALWDIGRQQEALAYFEDAARVLERALGPSNYETSVQWHTLADALFEVDARQNLQRCIELYTRTLHVRRQILPPDHDAIHGVLTSLARALERQGDHAARHGNWALAVYSFQSAYSRLRGFKQDFETYQSLDVGRKLVEALEKLGRIDEAVTLRSEIKATENALRGYNPIDGMMSRSGLKNKFQLPRN